MAGDHFVGLSAIFQNRYPLQSSKPRYSSIYSGDILCFSTTSSGWLSQVDTYIFQWGAFSTIAQSDIMIKESSPTRLVPWQNP